MEQKEGAYFTQEKEGEAVTLKIRFAQFKEAVGTKEERSCECIKCFNIVLSVLLLVMGLVCMIMGIVCHTKYYYQFKYIGEGYVNVVTVFIVSGISMIIAGACGTFSIVKKSYCALVFCLIILAVLLIFHFVLGGFAFAYRSRTDHMTEKALIRGYHKYFRDMGSQEFMDWSQKKFKCCGFTGPNDYGAGNKTHSSTKSPLTTTDKKTTTTPMPAGVQTTTVGNTITTAQVTNATTVVTTTASQVTTTNFINSSPTKNSTLPPTTSTKPPTTTTKPSTTTTKPPTTTTEPPTTTTKPPTTTTEPPTTTTKPPTTTTEPPTTTTKPPTTTTEPPTTTTEPPTTTTKPPTTTTKAPTTTSKPSTTTTKPPTTTTQPPATTQTTTTPKATTTMTKNIVNAAGDSFNFKSQGELPESCCQETKLAVTCINRPYDIYKRGCGEKFSGFLKKIMCAIGSIAFVMIFFDLLHLITAALCSKMIKEEATYTKL